MPFRRFLAFAGLGIFPASRCRDAEVRHGLTLLGVPDLWLVAEVAHQDDAVEAWHGCLLWFFVHGFVFAWLCVPPSHFGEPARCEVKVSLDGKAQATADVVDLR